MKIEIILVIALFMVLISMQYTLNKILMELRMLRKAKELEAFKRENSTREPR